MAVVKSILKLTNFEAVIKVAGKGLYKGIDDFATINLRGDMYDPATELLEPFASTPKTPLRVWG